LRSATPQKSSTSQEIWSYITKIWLKIWVSTGRTKGESNFMNDIGISSAPAAFDLMDITASLSLSVENENSGTFCLRDTANSSVPFNKRSRQKIIV
jgi:hypothetical protein